VLEKTLKQKAPVILLAFVGIWIVVKVFGMVLETVGEKRGRYRAALAENVVVGMEQMLYKRFMPALIYDEKGGAEAKILQGQVEELFPLYGYLAVSDVAEDENEEWLKKAMEENRVLRENQGQGIIVSQSAEEMNEREPDGIQAEDSAGDRDLKETADESGKLVEGTEGNVNDGGEGDREEADEMSLAELLKAENEAAQQMLAAQQISTFVPASRQAQVDLTPLLEYETLLKEFYTVDANTSASSEKLNVAAFLEKDMGVSKEAAGPQILIFHTHSQEGFADSVPGDESTTIMGVGDRLTEILQEVYGYEVLHHRGKYDVDSRDDAYGEALPDITKVLAENPSIQVVIDLHRDSMPEGTRLVMDLDGRPTARFMFFNGISRTRKTGNISYLYNENLEGNLAFSFQMQLKALEYYPGLTRKIYLKAYRYNMHLKDKYLLVELGAQNNTVEEAMNACDPLAHILDMVLSGN